MFLSRLASVARSRGNVHQLSSKLLPSIIDELLIQPEFILDLFQKCAISTTPAVCAKLDLQKPTDSLKTSNSSDPVVRINEQLKSNEVGRMFAVVQLCGKQFKVTAGDVILVEGFWEPTNGDKLRLDKVIMACSQLCNF